MLCVGTLARVASSVTTPRTHGAPRRAGYLWMLAHFVSSVITSSQSKVSTLLVTLVYLNRVKSSLDLESFGVTRVRERIFLGAIVLATKVRIRNTWTRAQPDESFTVYGRPSTLKQEVGPCGSNVHRARHQQCRITLVARTRLGLIGNGVQCKGTI